MADILGVNMRRLVGGVGVYGAPVVSFLLLGLLLHTTNPVESGPVVILLVFVLFYTLVAATLAVVLRVIEAVVRMLMSERTTSFRKWYYVSGVVSLVPVLFVALNTLRQLGVLEVVLILLFVLLGSFYVMRRAGK